MTPRRIKVLDVRCHYHQESLYCFCDSESKDLPNHISNSDPVLTPEQRGPLAWAPCFRRSTGAFLWLRAPQEHEESVGSLKSTLPITPPINHTPRTWEATVPSQAALNQPPCLPSSSPVHTPPPPWLTRHQCPHPSEEGWPGDAARRERGLSAEPGVTCRCPHASH